MTAIVVMYALVAAAVLAQGLLERVVDDRSRRRYTLGWHVAVAIGWGPGMVIVLVTMLKDYMSSRNVRMRYDE